MKKSLEHENAEFQRPIGRFLLGLEEKRIMHDPYEYAARFAANYRDILNPQWRAARVSVEEMYGQRVELEFATNSHVHGHYTWHLCAKSEQYDIFCSENGEWGATHYEFSSLRAVMRRHEVTDSGVLEGLQSIIEYMTDTYDFHKNASTIRGDSTRTRAAIQELDARKSTIGLVHGEERNLMALKSHLFIAGFPVGSRDISFQPPLIQ